MHGSPAEDAGTSLVEEWLARHLRDAVQDPGPQRGLHDDPPKTGPLGDLDEVEAGTDDSTDVAAAEDGEDEAFDPDEAWLALACGELPPLATLERVAALHCLVARVQAMEAAALADLTRAMSGEPHPELKADGSLVTPARAPVAAKVIDAVAPALCLGRVAAARRIQDADQLTRCLQTTHELLAGGFIDTAIAHVVVRGTAGCSEALAIAVDRSLAHELIGVTAGRARSMVETEITLQDASATTDRAAAAIKSRRVEYRPAPDGLGELRLIGPAPTVRALHDTLTARAKETGPGSVDPYADLTNPPTSPATEPSPRPSPERGHSAGACAASSPTPSPERSPGWTGTPTHPAPSPRPTAATTTSRTTATVVVLTPEVAGRVKVARQVVHRAPTPPPATASPPACDAS